MLEHEQVRHYRSLPCAKMAVAFFRISLVSRKSAFSLRRRVSSSSRGMPWPTNAFRLPLDSSLASSSHLYKAPGRIPNSLAISAFGRSDPCANSTAFRLNSAVNTRRSVPRIAPFLVYQLPNYVSTISGQVQIPSRFFYFHTTP